jgi:hypothetical protein
MDTRRRPPRAPVAAWGRRLASSVDSRHREAALAFLLSVLAAALVAAPVVVERAVEGVRFRDQVGTFPVEVSLCHDGRSTLDTGIFGKVFWDQTGALGFGAYARATGPPAAGGTLASYVDPAFVEANVAFIRDPDTVVAAYSTEMRAALRRQILREELVAGLLGGAVIFLLVPRRRLRGVPRGRAIAVSVLVGGVAIGLSTAGAVTLFQDWSCSEASGPTYAARDLPNPTFSSPQMSEIASQVRPFIDKNTDRLDAAAAGYEEKAAVTFAAAAQSRAATLAPRDGETIVLGEADPQGSYVGVHVRTAMYENLVGLLGPEAISLRTISGDVTSNGTVAESSFIKAEAKVGPDIPVAAVGGDHDSEKTWKQMEDVGFAVPDLKTVEVGGLSVTGANDREHKTLFGGEITNTSGISEEELGRQLREQVGDSTGIVLMHQPAALAGFLGIDSLSALRDRPPSTSSLTTPSDDGIPDVPPGTVDVGHLHDPAGPWVLWNTDGPEVTWTVVDQLGTAGGVENAPTFSRFSTPLSAPLKPLMVRLQYVNTETGLQTGYATVECGLDGRCTISNRTDVGLPGGQPRPTIGTPASPE